MEQRTFDEFCIQLFSDGMFTDNLYNEMMSVANSFGLSTVCLGG